MMDSECASSLVDYINDYRDSHASNILYYENFLAKSFNQIYNSTKHEYPYEVKIPKSLGEMLAGDMEPSRIIKVEKPFTYGNTPIWFGNSSKGVKVRFGYKDGDSRFPSQQSLDDKEIHMVLAGRTGMGKSVTLNAIVYGMLFEYAPWEICLTMCDAKIVEFKNYAKGPKIPHISSIAATGDVDYLLSVLEDKYNEMVKLNTVFTNVGARNIESFRKKTGLTVPQNVIVIDEFTAMLAGAKNKANRLIELIDLFARLGRNTGFHLILSSQSLGSDVPKALMANITTRTSLGATKEISEAILENDEAGYINDKGVLIYTNGTYKLKGKEGNIRFNVPYLTDNMFVDLAKHLEKLSKEINFTRPLTFYDEEAVIHQGGYREYLESFKFDKNQILLGEPSYVIADREKVVKLKFTGSDLENIVILNSSKESQIRYATMIKENIESLGNDALTVLFNADNEVAVKSGFSKIAKMDIKMKDAENEMFEILLKTMYMKKLMLEVDEYVYDNDLEHNDVSDELLKDSLTELGISGQFTATNRARAYEACSRLKSKEYTTALGRPANLSEDLTDMFYQLQSNGFLNKKATKENVKFNYFVIIGLNKILGWGRDPKSKLKERLKKALQDCVEANARFIIIASDMDETYELNTAIRWAILDNPSSKDVNRFKGLDYPTAVRPVLGVVFDTVSKQVFKFKKMYFDGELVG